MSAAAYSAVEPAAAAAAAATAAVSKHLSRLAASFRNQILGFVALIKDDESIKVRPSPVNELLQAGVPLVTGAGQAGVGQENDSLAHTHLHSPGHHNMNLAYCKYRIA